MSEPKKDRIDIHSCLVSEEDPGQRAVRGFTAVEYAMPRGSVAMYFPEGNVLVPLDCHDAQSGTPGYKSIPVRISAAADA